MTAETPNTELSVTSTAPDGDDASTFFLEVVDPTVAEFLAQPADRRRGCLACLCLASMADHYFHARPAATGSSKDERAFRTLISDENWAVGQVIGVANATKHVLRRPGRVGYQDVSVRRITLGNLRSGWPINGTQVMIEVKDGELWLLSDLVEETANFWRRRLMA